MKAIIIGAGIAGLGAASYFKRMGHDVLVIEASDRVGGRAVTYRRPGTHDLVDVGTQYYHSSYRRALQLIEMAGLRSKLKKITGRTRIYDNTLARGSFLFNRDLPWYPPAGIIGNLRLGIFLAKDFLSYPMDPFSLDIKARADDVHALKSSSNTVLHNSIIRPLALVGGLSEPSDMDLSLHHLHRLVKIIIHTDYLSLSDGTASLHEAIASRLDIRFESPATGLIEEGGKITGVQLEQQSLRADHVVLATTPSVAAGLIPGHWEQARSFLSGIKFPAFTLPVFFLDRPLEKDVWSFLLHQHNRKISFLTDAAQKNPDMVPSGKSIIQPWICYPHSMEISKYSDDQIISLCTGELEDIFPGFSSWIEDVYITRHDYGVPIHSVGHVRKACEVMRIMDSHNLSLCGDYLSGGYMESALWSADRAATVFG